MLQKSQPRRELGHQRRRNRHQLPSRFLLHPVSVILMLVVLLVVLGNVISLYLLLDIASKSSEIDVRQLSPLSLRVKPIVETVTAAGDNQKAAASSQPPPAEYGDREVDFLQFTWRHSKNITDDSTEANYRDAFSASWWQPLQTFLKIDAFEKISGSPEGASFEVFSKNSQHVRMTRDWLVSGVEHMSKWWKVVLEYNDAIPSTRANIVGIFKRYTYSADRKIFFDHVNRKNTIEEEDAMHVSASTLAMIAYMPSSSKEITVWSLSATVMSLLQVGIGRIVVSGHQQTDEPLVRKAFSIVKNATRDWNYDGERTSSKLEFCISANASTGIHDTAFNVPMAVLKKIRHVVLHKEDESSVVSCWLGGSSQLDRDRWKYLFLTEPDTILSTKPEAFPGLTRALRRGDVLAPHRYQPLPHFSDFSGVHGMGNGGNILPNKPPFQDVVEIDAFSSTKTNSCCDQGKYKPWLLHDKCEGGFWWQCGYKAMRTPENIPIIDSDGDCGPELTQVIVAHKRLLGYTLMRLKRGTGVVYASSNSGKTCHPKAGQCNDSTKNLSE